MTTHKEVMQQALEALAAIQEVYGTELGPGTHHMIEANINALRAVLAESKVIRSEEGTCYYADKDGNPVDEPVAWLYTIDGYSEALMPGEVEQGWFMVHPEMYHPLYLRPQRSLRNNDKLDANIAKSERELAAAEEIERLRKDQKRLDWLADKENAIGNIQLPTECVTRNLHSLRAAIDDAMLLPPNVEVTDLAAASLPQGPCGLPGSATGTNEGREP